MTDRASAALLRALQLHHAETAAHSLRVARGARLIGEELGLLPVDLDNLYDGALLHDVGKIGVPVTVIDKTERPTEEEWALIRAHTRAGAETVRGLFPEPVCRVVAEHHECYDGTGYPAGKAGADIAIEARICAVADAFDAITHPRACALRGRRDHVPYAVAAHEIVSWAGRQFDPRVVEAFKRVAQEEWLAISRGGEV